MATQAQAIQLLSHSIRPALQRIGLWNPASEQILLGTALVESDLLYRKQIGGGPARGLFQMEPATHDDIWDNFLRYRQRLARSILSLLRSPDSNKLLELERNDPYAAAMARAHYLRVPQPLPASGDVGGMAACWKQYYNTPLGAGTVDKYIQRWNQTMGEA